MYTTVGAQQSQEKIPTSKVRVGTYDSRALAIAYYSSKPFKRQIKEMRTEYENAKGAGDEKRLRELEIDGSTQQELMHKQGFSIWQVDNILQKIKGEIPEVATQADVDIIISRWAAVYQRTGVEFIDVTRLMVMLFDPDEQTLKMIEDIQKQTPIPLEELKDHQD
jgi:hypothetical protein